MFYRSVEGLAPIQRSYGDEFAFQTVEGNGRDRGSRRITRMFDEKDSDIHRVVRAVSIVCYAGLMIWIPLYDWCTGCNSRGDLTYCSGTQ